MKNWKPEGSRSSCARYYGNMKQLCGVRRYFCGEGRAAGTEAVEVNTGGGLRFTVLPGRGMDIPEMSYRGIPISYMTKAGISSAAMYDPSGDGWLKNFFGGVLTTCGLSNAGPACTGNLGILKDVPLGLHGGISNTPADNVCTREEWNGDSYRMSVSGRMEEGRLHGEHLELRRTIETGLGETSLRITDEFTNTGEAGEMLMFFYHINIGHPLLDEGARFSAPVKKIWAETDHAKAGLPVYDLCGMPRAGYLEQQFFIDMDADRHGNTLCALINEELELAVYLRYNIHELPCIAEWKILRNAEYVMAFEPGNCHAIGREEQIKQGKQQILAPTETRKVHYEIGIADGADEIVELEKEIKGRKTSHG